MPKWHVYLTRYYSRFVHKLRISTKTPTMTKAEEVPCSRIHPAALHYHLHQDGPPALVYSSNEHQANRRSRYYEPSSGRGRAADVPLCCRQVVAAPDDGNVQLAEAALKLVLSALTACLRSCCRRPRGPTPTGTPGRRTAGTRGRPPCRAGSWPLTSWRRAPVRRLIVHQARRLGPGRAGRPAPRSPPPGARGCAEAAPAPPSDNSSMRSTSRPRLLTTFHFFQLKRHDQDERGSMGRHRERRGQRRHRQLQEDSGRRGRGSLSGRTRHGGPLRPPPPLPLPASYRGEPLLLDLVGG